MKIKIIVTRSCFGNFTFDIFGGQGKKIASGAMFTRRENCMRLVKKIARALRCPVEYIDLENDFEA